MRRNRVFWYPNGDKPDCYKCDICAEETNKPSDYINSHIIAHGYAKKLQEERDNYKKLPTSPSYVYNGLFLCRQCDKHFEDHYITILEDGTITINELATPQKKYRKLRNTKVKWAAEIDNNVDFPTSEALTYRNTLPPILGEHRKLDFGVDPDDFSEDLEEECVLLKRGLKQAGKSKAAKVKKITKIPLSKMKQKKRAK